MKLPSYPRYKPSCVECLGEIPEHWEVKRLKYVLAARLKYGANEAAELDDPHLPRYVRITDIDENDGLRKETFKSLPSKVAAEYLLCKGDLLFARSGATSGKTFLYRTNWGACAYAGYLIRARIAEEKAVPEFVRYFTASTCYWQWLSSAFIQATIQNVSAERYASLELPLPPPGEQAVIVDFLDSQTAQIDTLVAKKRLLIERLREKRNALISRTVTRGLPPDNATAYGLAPIPKLKPSGIEWLGDLPENWKIKRLRYVLTRNDGGVWGDEADPEGTVVLRSTEQTLDGGWMIEEPARRVLSELEKRAAMLETGDLVVTKSSGSALHIGKTSLVTEKVARIPACFSNFMQRLRMVNSVEPRLAFYLLNCPTGRQQLIVNSNTTTGLSNLTRSVLGNVLFTYPDSLREQRAIADYIDRETGKIDLIVNKIETAIERLQEYRTALISSAVTGKIDVRKVVA